MPPTYLSLEAWEKDARKTNTDMWFFKAKNSSNSKGELKIHLFLLNMYIATTTYTETLLALDARLTQFFFPQGISVARTVEEGKQILSLAAAGGNKATLATTFDNAFMVRFAKALQEQNHSVPMETLRAAFNGSLCSDKKKLDQAMKGYIIQRGVQKPLLIKEGRKFCLRIYVLAVVRPQGSGTGTGTIPIQLKLPTVATMEKEQKEKESEEKQEEGKSEAVPSATSAAQRNIEVYVSTLEIARPQKSPFDAESTDPAAQYEDSSTLYASISDGTCYPKERWFNTQFPQIKQAVRRVMTSGMTLHDSEKHTNSEQYKRHFAYEITNKCGATPENVNGLGMEKEGRIAMMGWDFMIDEHDKPWLIEINAICNLVHSKNSERDTFNKTKLAEAFYDTVLAEVPTQSEFLHRVL